MTIRGDYVGVMKTRPRQLVESFEAAVDGRDIDGGDPFVTALANDMRSQLDGSAPIATRVLEALLAQGLSADVLAASSRLDDDVPAPVLVPGWPRRSPVMRVAVAKIAGLTLAAKVALASVALAAGTAGAGAAGVLPAPAQAAFDRAASIVSNVDNRPEQVDRTDSRIDNRTENRTDNPTVDGDADPLTPDVDPDRRDSDVRDGIERSDPDDRDQEFGRDVAEEASRTRADDGVRGQSRQPEVDNHTRPSGEENTQSADGEQDRISGQDAPSTPDPSSTRRQD